MSPVIADDGFTYEKDAIGKWFARDSPTSPMTNMQMTSLVLIDNQKLREQIENYLKDLDFDPFNWDRGRRTRFSSTSEIILKQIKSNPALNILCVIYKKKNSIF